MDDQNNEVPISLSLLNQDILFSEDSISIQNESAEIQNNEKTASEVEDKQVKDTISLSDVSRELVALRKIFDERLSYDKTKEEAFDHLYEELDEFKKNSVFNYNRPLYIDIILLFDRIENIKTGIDHSNSSSADFELILETLTDELLEILYRQGIEVIVHSLKKFDPTIQRAIGMEQASNEEENNQIARVVRRGFLFNNQILRAEEVLVLKYNEVRV